MKTLNVDLGERTYPIHIGHGLIDSDLLGSVIRGRQLLLVTDETVAPLYLERVLSNLTAFEVATVILPDGENHKNIGTLDLIFSEALTRRFSRNVTMVALGGGVVGDIVGFAAATSLARTDLEKMYRQVRPWRHRKLVLSRRQSGNIEKEITEAAPPCAQDAPSQ